MRVALVGVLVLVAALSFAYAQPEVHQAPVGYYNMHVATAAPTHSLNYLMTAVSTAAEPDTDSFAYKLGNGGVNAATAWVDVPDDIGRVSDEQNVLAGCTLGFGEGVFNGLMRGMAGVYDMVTFMFPPYDKLQAKPKYRVEQPEKELKINLIRW